MTFQQFYYSINQQSAEISKFFEKISKIETPEFFLMAIFLFFKCWNFLYMLNIVVLLTPSNHKTASSTTCYLSPLIVHTVSTKSMLAHLLSAQNHWFEIIRVFGHLHFRCYTTWSLLCIKFEMSIWSKIIRSTRKRQGIAE
jgi:hypothetical protein